jgi:hypothetical protein
MLHNDGFHNPVVPRIPWSVHLRLILSFQGNELRSTRSEMKLVTILEQLPENFTARLPVIPEKEGPECKAS